MERQVRQCDVTLQPNLAHFLPRNRIPVSPTFLQRRAAIAISNNPFTRNNLIKGYFHSRAHLCNESTRARNHLAVLVSKAASNALSLSLSSRLFPASESCLAREKQWLLYWQVSFRANNPAPARLKAPSECLCAPALGCRAICVNNARSLYAALSSSARFYGVFV